MPTIGEEKHSQFPQGLSVRVSFTSRREPVQTACAFDAPVDYSSTLHARSGPRFLSLRSKLGKSGETWGGRHIKGLKGVDLGGLFSVPGGRGMLDVQRHIAFISHPSNEHREAKPRKV